MTSKRLKLLVLTALLLTSVFAQAQNQEGVAMLSWEDFVEMVADDSDEDNAPDEELFEQLYELHANPININRATKEDLAALPFISEEQALHIIIYIEKYGAMATLGELMFISELDKRERDMLRLFVYAGEGKTALNTTPTVKDLLSHSKSELTWRTDVPFYTKAGFAHYSDSVLQKSPNKVYRGDRYHHSLHYSLTSLNHLQAGVQMEKDAGEQGVDYLSGYVMIKDIGIVDRAIVGNYRISFGQGLAINTSSRYGKMMMLNQLSRIDRGITQHSSLAEAGFLTGGAAAFRLGGTLVSAFASHRNTDGTYNNDSLGLSSLKTDGLHRTQLERSKKGNLAITNFGANIHWQHDALQLSATAVATHLSVPLAPKHNTPSTLYRLYNAQGKDFFVGSIAYSYRYKRISIAGETAVSTTDTLSGFASLNTLRWRLNSNNAITLIGRYYGAKFVSINGKAFSENSLPQNEEGIFLGWTTRAIRNIKFDAYADFMYFPWLKYKVSDSSYGLEAVAQMEYTPSKALSFTMRYRFKSKQRDFDYTLDEEKFTSLQYKNNQNLKLQMNYAVSPQLSFKTLATGVFTRFGIKDELGFAIGENVRWQHPTTKARIDVGITYFNTDSYDARVYAYEPSLLYSFGFSSYYYQGIRTTLLATLPLMRNKLFVTAKLASTRYFNRETIGTSLDLIKANHREDLQVQLRWKI